MLKPHGFGNPEPLFIDKGLEVANSHIVGEGHLKMKINKENTIWDAIGFGLGRYSSENLSNIDLLFVPSVNEWQGRRSIQLKVKDLRTVT